MIVKFWVQPNPIGGGIDQIDSETALLYPVLEIPRIRFESFNRLLTAEKGSKSLI